MKKYFIHNGQAQAGPYDISDLKSFGISKDTNVWFEGLSGWQPAINIDELKHLFSTPPPFRQSSTKPESPAYKTGKSVAKWLWPVMITVILALVGIFLYNQVSQQKENDHFQNIARQQEDMRQTTRNNITNLVIVERSSYLYSSWGGIKNLKISVSNNTNYILDLVQVKVRYNKPDGTEWDNKIIDFNFINPNTKMTIPVEDTQRGVGVTYEVITIKSNALGL